MIPGLQAPAGVTLPVGDPARWASTLDVAELKRHVDWCRAPATSTTDKGTRLEQLACWIFSHIPGLTAEKKNTFSDDGAQEIDILFWNHQHSDGFQTFGDTVMVECKNWERKVDSGDVAWFDWKLRLGGANVGILVAANGITSEASRRQAAVGILAQANADRPPRRILVVTLDDIEAIASTDDLKRLLRHKALGLAGRDPFS